MEFDSIDFNLFVPFSSDVGDLISQWYGMYISWNIIIADI